MDYKQRFGIDLHIHSTASDGTLTPSEILEMAQDLNLGAIAITDHDTIAGSIEALNLTIPASIEFVPGVEISAASIPPFDKASSFHILGYFIQTDDPLLNRTLNELQSVRKSRNEEILKRLNMLDIDISLEEVHQVSGTGELGRPHFAQALVKKKLVPSIQDAFDHYLGKGKPAYVDKKRLSCSQAISTIKKAGGISVLAHPGLLNIEQTNDMERLINVLKEVGLEGIEVYYPEHTELQVEQYLQLAKSKNLLITGGTDFHGGLTPDVHMGSGYGDFHVPYSLYENLREHVNAPNNITKLEKKIGYRFQDQKFLEEAIRHSSYVNELANVDIRDNERFEFLGDAVLNLVIGNILMHRCPDLKEGYLTRIRANMVNETQLAAIADTLNLGSHILLGKGEFRTGGYKKNSILADTMEAIIAAIYLDGGFEAAYTTIERLFSNLLNTMNGQIKSLDFKSELQEFVQLHYKSTPQYQVIEERGPDHDKTFGVRLKVCDLQTNGAGKSKKAAEQDAARKALKAIKSNE